MSLKFLFLFHLVIFKFTSNNYELMFGSIFYIYDFLILSIFLVLLGFFCIFIFFKSFMSTYVIASSMMN